MHELVAAYLGVKPKRRPADVPFGPVASDDPSGIGAMIRQFPNGFVRS